MASAAVGSKRSYTAMSGDDLANLASPRAVHVTPVFEEQSSREQTPNHVKAAIGEFTSSVITSAQSTPRRTPAPAITPFLFSRKFAPDASIALIGIRGTGKSTLAVIASIACRRRIVDVDDVFEEATGFSTAKYRKQFGGANHNLRQEELLKNVLRSHDKGAIIVCNGGSLERHGQSLMQEFSKTHPVVHVMRDSHSVHEYLGAIPISRLEDMLTFTAPLLRRCSNFEFYNLSEATNSAAAPADSEGTSTPSFLTLKRAQRTFLKFLSIVTSYENVEGTKATPIPPLEPGYPLSDVPTELRNYTCVVQIPLGNLLTADVDIPQLELGSDAVEIQVSAALANSSKKVMDDISKAVSKVRRSTIIPIIYHVIRESTSLESQSTYLENVLHGLRLAPEYATMDLSFDQDTQKDILTSRGTTKIIGCLQADRSWTDDFWVDQYRIALELGCAVVRFTRPAVTIEEDDAIEVLKWRARSLNTGIPLVCYSKGHAGRRSVCLNKHFTPVLPSPSASQVDSTSDKSFGLTAREVTQALYASCTFDAMQIYIIGASLEYSVSPAMHNAGYKACGMPHIFSRVQSSSLKSLTELVRNPNFGGSIVIQPFKIEVISLADALSQHARAIGAVNTLIPVRHLKKDGTIPSELDLFQERNRSGPIQALYGENTEWIGIRSCIRRGLSPANAVRPTSSALVIGAGGMARAAVYALLQLGVQNIAIFNRTFEKAEKLVHHFTRLISSTRTTTASQPDSFPKFHILKTYEDAWPEDMRQATIILSCIPADSIDGKPAPRFTLPSGWMKSPTGGVVMEIAYKTLNTPLMHQVQKENPRLWTYMDGLDFLPEQAFAQFELFTGKRAPRRIMREEVLRAWRDEQGNSHPDMIEKRLKAVYDQEP